MRARMDAGGAGKRCGGEGEEENRRAYSVTPGRLFRFSDYAGQAGPVAFRRSGRERARPARISGQVPEEWGKMRTVSAGGGFGRFIGETEREERA